MLSLHNYHSSAEIDRLNALVETARTRLATLRALNAGLLAALKRVDGINDNPACFNAEIGAVVTAAIAKAKG